MEPKDNIIWPSFKRQFNTAVSGDNTVRKAVPYLDRYQQEQLERQQERQKRWEKQIHKRAVQKEFEERIGRSVTEHEYLEANAMYENAGDMDKDEFCREWLKIGNSRLVKCLAEKTYQQHKALQEKELLLKESKLIWSDAADAMLEIEQGILNGETTEHITELLDLKAWWLVGAKELVLRKIKMGMDLSKNDKNYINEHLK